MSRRDKSLWSRLTAAIKPSTQAPEVEGEEKPEEGDADETKDVPAPGDDAPPAEGKDKPKDDDAPADDAPPPAEGDPPASTEPQPGTKEMFDALKPEFGATFAGKAVDEKMTLQEAVAEYADGAAVKVKTISATNEELAAQNAKLTAKLAGFMEGEEPATSTSSDDVQMKGQISRIAELEKRGVPSGRAKLAAYIGARMNKG